MLFLHECVHWQINSICGCDGGVGVVVDGVGLGVPGDFGRVGCDSEKAVLLHGINEIVGYTVVPFLCLILFCVYLFGDRSEGVV